MRPALVRFSRSIKVIYSAASPRSRRGVGGRGREGGKEKGKRGREKERKGREGWKG